MNRVTIVPDDEAHWLALRKSDLTSTDISAIFSLSPYKTPYELWWEKKSGEAAPFVGNSRVTWGKRLESSVAAGIAEDREWLIRPMKEYMRIPELRIGSSFDFRVLTGDALPTLGTLDTADDAILEIKCVDWLAFRDGWIIDGDYIEAPAHIEIQAQHEMLVSGLRRLYLGVMVGGNDVRVIEREADDSVQRGILAAAAAFWASIDANQPPPPVMPDDADAVIRMHQFAEPGKLLDARSDADLATMLREYKRLGDISRDADEQRKVLKADLLARIGDAEKVLSSAGKVSAGLIGPTHVEYDRAGYRDFRFYPAKAAQEAAQ